MSRTLIVTAGGLAVLAAVMVGVAQLTGGNGAKPHPLGTEILVGYQEIGSDGSTGPSARIGLTVFAVRAGTQEDLEANGIRVDPEDRTATPYYVDARFANNGPDAVERNLSVGLQDWEGNLFRKPIIVGVRRRAVRAVPRERRRHAGAGRELRELHARPRPRRPGRRQGLLPQPQRA